MPYEIDRSGWQGAKIGVAIGIGMLVMGGAIAGLSTPALAQITPDQTLGTERSQVTPNVRRRGHRIDRIDGGAQRGRHLFHSFREFNVRDGQRVYFANPAGIDTILSRVTGNTRSQILGTLGVDGGANLWFLNPNGILFGANAQLDIGGTFVASTADSVRFDNWTFSATNPDAPPLLTLNLTPGLQYGGIPSGSAIASTGNLTVGKDLTLAADTLTLSGQVQAGRTLTLFAQDRVQIRDSAVNPFVAAAGHHLLVQGDRTIDIVALSHPQSGFWAGGDLVLRSPTPVVADAHFTAGDNFQIEQPNGGLGDLLSLTDPVIRTGGNVSFDSYTGASLHIFAGGSVTVGDITITAPDGTTGINDTLTLSDGTPLTVSGNTQPTLDIRAGTTAVGNPGGLTGTPSPINPNLTGTPASAAITVGTVTINQPNGLVLLTNQYQPDRTLQGRSPIRIGSIDVSNDAGSGAVVVDSRSGIELEGAVTATSVTGNGGDIRFLADGDIELQSGSSLLSQGNAGGTLTLTSRGTLLIAGLQREQPFTEIQSLTTGTGTGGDINLTANTIFVGGADVFVTLGEGATGQGGNLNIRANALTADSVSTLIADVVGTGNGGDVTVTVADAILLNDSFLGTAVADIGVGQSGDVTVRARSLTGTNGGQIGSFTLGTGDTGNVSIQARDFVSFDGILVFGPDTFASGAFSTVASGAVGNGGNLAIATPTLSLTNGAQLRVTTEGDGNAGNITVSAPNAVTIADTFIAIGEDGNPRLFPSAIVSEVLQGATGNGGNIRIDTAQFTATNGGLVSATTEDQGRAGTLTLDASESLTLTGFASPTGALSLPVFESVTQGIRAIEQRSGLFANTQPSASGDGGSIGVRAGQVRIEDGAVIFVGSSGSGRGGNIRVQADSLVLDGNQASIFAQTRSTDGGNITLGIRDVLVLRRNSQISTTAGTAAAGGNGGDIRINTRYLTAVPDENSDITANAFAGNGGNIRITAEGVFGIQFQDEVTNRSDITASSQFGSDGVVQIDQPDVDPSQGLADLPAEVVDASQLIAQGCSSGGAIAQEVGEFVITGRGGLPASPTERLAGQAVAVGWESVDVPPPTSPGSVSTPTSAQPGAIAEAQSLVRGADGQMLLTAQPTTGATHVPWATSSTCPAQ